MKKSNVCKGCKREKNPEEGKKERFSDDEKAQCSSRRMKLMRHFLRPSPNASVQIVYRAAKDKKKEDCHVKPKNTSKAAKKAKKACKKHKKSKKHSFEVQTTIIFCTFLFTGELK